MPTYHRMNVSTSMSGENSMGHKDAQHSNWTAAGNGRATRQNHEAPEHKEHGGNRNFNAAFVVLVGIFLWLVQPTRADVSGTILGTVTDPTTAVVPGAKVVLRNVNTGLVRETVTD